MNSPYWSERHLPWYANCYSSWGLGTLNWTHAVTSTGVFSRARASNFSRKTRSRRDVFRIVAADGGCSGPEYFRCDIILGPVPLVEILKENGSSNVSCNQKHFSMAPIRALDIVCSPHYPIWRTRTKSYVGLLWKSNFRRDQSSHVLPTVDAARRALSVHHIRFCVPPPHLGGLSLPLPWRNKCRTRSNRLEVSA